MPSSLSWRRVTKIRGATCGRPKVKTSCARSTPPDRRSPPSSPTVTLFQRRHTSGPILPGIAAPGNGLLKTFGLVVARDSKGLFPVRVREQIAGNPALIAIIEPLLAVWHAIRDQVAMLDRQMLARARHDQVARRLMTLPGVCAVIPL